MVNVYRDCADMLNLGFRAFERRRESQVHSHTPQITTFTSPFSTLYKDSLDSVLNLFIQLIAQKLVPITILISTFRWLLDHSSVVTMEFQLVARIWEGGYYVRCLLAFHSRECLQHLWVEQCLITCFSYRFITIAANHPMTTFFSTLF